MNETTFDAEIPILGETRAVTTDGAPLSVPFPNDVSEGGSGLPTLQTVSSSSLSGVEHETSEAGSMGPQELISRTHLLANAARRATDLEAELREGGVYDVMKARLNVESSVTPSFSSVVNPAPSTAVTVRTVDSPSSTSTEIRNLPASAELKTPIAPGLLNNDSISQALLQNRRPGRIFFAFGRVIEVYDEDLSASVARYHATFDPLRDEDPLLAFGAVDGVLPGRTAEQSIAFRDLVIRWATAHRRWFWDSLPEAVAQLMKIKFSPQDLVVVRGEDGEEGTEYALNMLHLEQISQIALAVHQVLEGLYDFLGKVGNSRFPLDPGWKILRLLEDNISQPTLLTACSTLQFRLERATQRIDVFLNSVKLVLGMEALDSMSSVDSTQSSVRSEFGRDIPSYELAKLVAHPDYHRHVHHREALKIFQSAVPVAQKDIRDDFYKERQPKSVSRGPLPTPPALSPRSRVEKDGNTPGPH
jgi:hypothetical protein